jgi:hypothetical protein
MLDTPLRATSGASSVHEVPVSTREGYDYRESEVEARERGVVPHIRRRGEPPMPGCIRGEPRIGVVERTNN